MPWVFDSTATAAGFRTTGAYGTIGGNLMTGPTWFSLYNGASYYANGSLQMLFGVTNGLVSSIRFGTSTTSATASTLVNDRTTALELTTRGVTGTFTIDALNPLAFGRYIYNDIASAPGVYRTTLNIRNGIIYGIRNDVYTQILAPGYTGAVQNFTTQVNVQGSYGVGVYDLGTYIGVSAGVTGVFTTRRVYDVYFYPAWWCEVYYTKHDVYITNGLITQIDSFDQMQSYNC